MYIALAAYSCRDSLGFGRRTGLTAFPFKPSREDTGAIFVRNVSLRTAAPLRDRTEFDKGLKEAASGSTFRMSVRPSSERPASTIDSPDDLSLVSTGRHEISGSCAPDIAYVRFWRKQTCAVELATGGLVPGPPKLAPRQRCREPTVQISVFSASARASSTSIPR
jgi:hypothetical protein